MLRNSPLAQKYSRVLYILQGLKSRSVSLADLWNFFVCEDVVIGRQHCRFVVSASDTA